MNPTLNFCTGNKTEENGVVKWVGDDSANRFKTNLNKLGSQWRYANIPITYVLNSQGYRCPEFEQVNWADSVVFFGCSHVFGVGQPVEETLPSIVEKETGYASVNLGQPGSSLLYNSVNLQKLLDSGIRPKAVVLCQPAVDRTAVFKDDKVINHGPWHLVKEFRFSKILKSYTRHYVEDSENTHTVHSFLERAFVDVCKVAGIPLVNAFWGNRSQAVDLLAGAGVIDFARDQRHFGIETIKRSSSIVAENLKKVIDSEVK